MSSLSILIARGLVLLSLALGLAGGPAGAATAEGGYATADLARLAELLGQRGWHTRADGGGNLLITRSGAGPQRLAPPTQILAETPASSAPLVDPSWLAEGVPSRGSIIEQDAAAPLTRFPPAGGSRGLPPPEAAPKPAADGWMAPLAGRLEAGGWTVRRDAAGGLSFHREAVAPRRPASLGQGTIASQASGTLTRHPPAGLPATPPAGVAPERAAAPWEPQIREALTRRGWDLRRDAAGNLLLTPTGMGQASA